MKIEQFEDIEIWQEARKLTQIVFKISSSWQFNKDFRFRDQIRAAAGSIMDNTAEGYGRGGNREFINFLSIAKGSNEEVRSQSYRAYDFNYIDKDTIDELLALTNKISGKISRLIQYLKNSSQKGPKFNSGK